MPVCYRIARWSEVFETADSRRHKRLSWVSFPIGFSSNGYVSMVDEFGVESAAIYGAWSALVCVAGECPIRGLLTTSRGVGLSPGRLAMLTHLDRSVFERLIEWASREEIGWLEPVDTEEVSRLLSTEIDTETSTAFSESEEIDTRRTPKKPMKTRDIARIRQSNDCQTIANQSTNDLPDQTRPNLTLPNQTTTDRQTVAPSHLIVQTESPSSVVVEVSSLDFETVKSHAIPLLQVASTVDREFIWQVAWVAYALDKTLIKSFWESLKRGDVRKKQAWLRGAIRKACDERGENFYRLAKLVPPCPPKREAV